VRNRVLAMVVVGSVAGVLAVTQLTGAPWTRNADENRDIAAVNASDGYPRTGHPRSGHPRAGHPRSGHPRSGDPQQTGSATCARQILTTMSLPERVGQLFIGGVTSTSPTLGQLREIRHGHLGGVFLAGHNDIGVAATRQVTRQLQAEATSATTDGVRLWISADQEGGFVQSLSGAGFDTIPTALTQGGWTRSALMSRANRWGSQLRMAGVNLNLAPVADTVPRRLGTANAPIGYYSREYGHHPKVVARHVTAAIAGFQAAGVQTTAKHFPGLGRVRRNTDTSPDVTDHTTTRHDPYLLPFQRAIAGGVPVVMVSFARYTRVDPSEVAAFSRVVTGGMLRRDLGFAGVIVSDSMDAAAVGNVAVAARGLRFLRAGGTVVLSVDSSATLPMEAAVLSRAESNSHFRALVRRDALTVLTAKRRNGLLPCP
jgi:beta-N-acetylhexosaminidase